MASRYEEKRMGGYISGEDLKAKFAGSNANYDKDRDNPFGAGKMAPNTEGGYNLSVIPGPSVQKFDTGATRSADAGKNDYEGFLSFPVLEEFGEYMTRHRVQPDGSVRDSDNWQKGIPIASYVKSLLRHTLELWGLHRGVVSARLRREYPNRDLTFLRKETACAIFFNVQGFLHETLNKERGRTVNLAGLTNQRVA